MRLDPRRLDEVCAAIRANSTRRLATDPGGAYRVIERRCHEVGGMLELARRLDEHRLVRALEAHKDALRRLLETA